MVDAVLEGFLELGQGIVALSADVLSACRS